MKGEKGKGAGAPKQQFGVVQDARFERIHVDPRFRRFPKKDAKVEIDDRFAKMFTDDRFQMQSTVDKRGRKVQESKKSDDIKKYYRLKEEQQQLKKKKKAPAAEEPASEDESEEEEDEDAAAAAAATLPKAKKGKGKGPVPARPDSSSEESEDDEDDEVQRRWNRLRGLGGEVSSSEEEEGDAEDALDWADTVEEDEEARYLELVGGEETWGVGVYAIHKALEQVPNADATKRLALVDVDWSRLRAVDLYAALNSFVPKGGRLLKVTVYPSDYGLERMREEKTKGPQGIWKAGKKAAGADPDSDHDDPDSDHDDEEEEGKDVVNERLRAYERSKLRWYYAVAEFDSAACANAVYDQCDGLEFGRSSNVFDLRFVPDEQDFSGREVRDAAASLPADYEPPVYETKALQHTNVQLTWDQDDPSRRKVLHKKVTEKDLKEEDFKAYLASSGSEDEDEGQDPAALRARYRALLLGEPSGTKKAAAGEGNIAADDDAEAEAEAAGKGGARKEAGAMVVTFDSGLESLGARLLEKKKEAEQRAGETVWEGYLRKRKEKRAERKRQGRFGKGSDSDDSGGDTEEEDAFVLAENGGKEGEDDFFMDAAPTKGKKGAEKKKGGAKGEAIADADPFNDPFFQENAAFDEGAHSDSDQDAPKKGKSEKKGKKGAKGVDEDDKRKKAELELLLLDDGALRGAAHGDRLALKAGTSARDAPDVSGAAGKGKKTKKKQFKSAKDRRAEEFSDDEDIAKDQGEDFSLDLQDPRFNRLLTSHHFALDPTDPRFKATENAKKIIQEASRARRSGGQQAQQVQQEARAAAAPEAAAPERGQPAAEGGSAKGDLKLMVASLKRKAGGPGLAGSAGAPSAAKKAKGFGGKKQI